MPWASNEDLPEGVRSSLPDAAQTRFRQVANGRLAAGESDESAMRQGWHVVGIGWKKPKNGGRWVRKFDDGEDDLDKAWSDEARAAALAARRRRAKPKDVPGRSGGAGGDGGGSVGANGGAFSPDQKEMHTSLIEAGWRPATEADFSSNPAARAESMRHVRRTSGGITYGGYDAGAQTYVHPDRPGEAVGTGSHNPSHGSNWSYKVTIPAGPLLSKPGEPRTQFLGGTRGDSGTGAESLRAHLKLKKFEDDQFIKAEVAKVNEDLGLVFGYAIVSKVDGEPYFDSQGDYIPEDAMLKAATDFMVNSRVAKEMHSGEQVGAVVFAFPLTADIAKALDIEARKTGLLIAMRPGPDVLGKYKSGEYQGFSIGGSRLVDEDA